MSAAAVPSASPKGNNNGSDDIAASADKSTLSFLKQLRVDLGFFDFYVKVAEQMTGKTLPCGVLDYPKKFILRLVLIVVGSIFLNDCQAQPKLPIFLIVTGVVGLATQILEQITGSLLKDYQTTRKNVKDILIVLMSIFLFGWFAQGCVWVFSMPLPNMAQFPDSVTRILPGLVNDLLMLLSTSSLPTDELASVNSTMVSLLSPEKHCAFPIYGLAVGTVVSPIINGIGCFVISTVTAVVLYFLPSSKVENASNVEQLEMSNM